MKLFDPEKIETEIATMIRALEPRAQTPGAEGVVIRMQIAVIPAFVRWKFQEMNRGGTTDNEVCNAFVAFMSSQMAGLIADIHGSPTPARQDHFDLANGLLQGIGEEVGSILAGEAPGLLTQKVEAEHAH